MPADSVLTSLRRFERTVDRSNPSIGAKTQEGESRSIGVYREQWMARLVADK